MQTQSAVEMKRALRAIIQPTMMSETRGPTLLIAEIRSGHPVIGTRNGTVGSSIFAEFTNLEALMVLGVRKVPSRPVAGWETRLAIYEH